MKKPLVRPIAYSDESPCGLLLRASEENGWKSPNAFISAYGIHSSKNTSSFLSLVTHKSHWEHTCDIFGIENQIPCYERMKVSRGSKYNFQGLQVQYKGLRLKEPSICPDCINEKKYSLSIWDHKLITACTTHNIKLISICPECKEKLEWSRKGLSICSCGHTLNTLKSRQIDTEVTQYIEQVINKKDNSTLDLIFQFFEAFELFFNNIDTTVDQHQLAVFAGEALLNKQKVINLLCKHVKKVAQSYGVHPRLIISPFLSSSKKEIKELANSTLNKVAKSGFTIGKTLETLNFHISMLSAGKVLGVSQFLTKELVDSSILEVKQQAKNRIKTVTLSSINDLLILLTSTSKPKSSHITIASILISTSSEMSFVNLIKRIMDDNITFSGINISSGLLSVSIYINPFKGKKYDYLTVTDVAKICGVYSEAIRFVVKCGVLERIDPQETKGTALYIEEKIALNFNKKYVFAGRIAKDNNCSRSSIAMKIMASDIMPVSSPDIDNGLIYLFRRSDILSLDIDKVIKMKNYPTKTGRKKKNQKVINFEEQDIPLYTVAHQLGVSVPKVTSLIKKGFLIESANKSRSKSITKESFESVKSIQLDSSLVALQQASTSVHENEKAFLRRWVNSDLITLVENGIDRYISKKDLKKIKNHKKKYVTSEEAGIITNTHRTHMLNLEKQKLIKPAKYLISGKQKINFYNRKQVLEICNNHSL